MMPDITVLNNRRIRLSAMMGHSRPNGFKGRASTVLKDSTAMTWRKMIQMEMRSH